MNGIKFDIQANSKQYYLYTEEIIGHLFIPCYIQLYLITSILHVQHYWVSHGTWKSRHPAVPMANMQMSCGGVIPASQWRACCRAAASRPGTALMAGLGWQAAKCLSEGLLHKATQWPSTLSRLSPGNQFQDTEWEAQDCCTHHQSQGPGSIWYLLPSIQIWIIKIRQSNCHLIFTMGIPIPGKMVFLMKQGSFYSLCRNVRHFTTSLVSSPSHVIPMIASLWNETNGSAAVLLSHLSNFRANGELFVGVWQLGHHNHSEWMGKGTA